MSEFRSISFRLPVLISGLLLASVGISSWLAYRNVRSAVTQAAVDHLVVASVQVAEIMGGPMRARLESSTRIASIPDVRTFVVDPSTSQTAALTQALSTYLTSELRAIEIRSVDGTLLLNVGSPPPEGASEVEPSAITPGITPLYTRDGLVRFETIAPIHRAEGDTAITGWIILRMDLAVGGALAGLFSAMLGNELRLLITNQEGGTWTDLVGGILEIPAIFDEESESYFYTLPTGETRLAAAAPIPESPWVIWLDQPGRIALAPADTFLRTVWPYAISIVLLGTLFAWLLTRGITDSIIRVAGAAQGITSGDLGHRARVRRNDEIGDLAEAFNTMADQISQSHHDLENQVAERTVELRDAYHQLLEKQDELVRAERLATLGQLASGVGHELRNPLGVMTNAVYYLEIVLSEAPETVHDYLEILKGQIGLSEKIVGDLLDFARLKPPQVELVSIESIVDHQIQRLGPLNGITLSKEFPGDLSPVAVDPIQIGQVVLNILVNGIQAMANKGGTLRIRAHTRGDQVELAISDEGEGIPEANIEKIFEPLFTTKARGIGLGLAVSRSLVQGNRGSLTASSPPGEGATFLLTLPTRLEEGSG